MMLSSRCLVLLSAFTVFSGVLSDECSQEQLMKCIPFPLNKFADQNELGFYTTKEQLEEMCPQMKNGLNCIEEFTTRCMSPSRRSYFKKLYSGTHGEITKLCENEEYQEEFLRHRPCMHSVRKDHEACMEVHQEKLKLAGGTGVLSEDGGGNTPVISPEESAKYLRNVCCSFQEYLQCSKQVVLKKCGSETANFTERFLDRMASPLMELHCEGHDVGSDKCEGFRNHSEGFSSASHLSLSLLSVFAPLLLSRILFSST